MLRRVIAGLVLAVMAIGVWLLWPRGEEPAPSTTTVIAAGPTTTVTQTTSPTALPPSTSTSIAGDHVVATAEEAEEILRDLWFGWFEGIYNQDEERIREVVATEEQVEAGRRASESVEFTDAPFRDGILIREIEVLRSDNDCLAVWSESDSSFLEPGPPRIGIDILRRTEGRWKLLSAWANRKDLWEADCVVLLP